MKAYMSDGHGGIVRRNRAWDAEQYGDAGGARRMWTGPEAQDAAVREAERILADVEPHSARSGRRALDLLPIIGWDTPGDVAFALAESLRAILPVLDELAADAWAAVPLGQRTEAFAMEARNCATLDTL